MPFASSVGAEKGNDVDIHAPRLHLVIEGRNFLQDFSQSDARKALTFLINAKHSQMQHTGALPKRGFKCVFEKTCSAGGKHLVRPKVHYSDPNKLNAP